MLLHVSKLLVDPLKYTVAKPVVAPNTIGGKALYKLKQPDGKYKDTLVSNNFDKMVQMLADAVAHKIKVA